MSDASPDLIRRSRQILGNQYAHVGGDGEYEAEGPAPSPSGSTSTRTADTTSSDPESDTTRFLSGKPRGSRFSRAEIEEVARNCQLDLWENRQLVSSTPLDVIDAELALKRAGFTVVDDNTLGEFDDGSAVSGILDRANSLIRLSSRFPTEVRNFTMAHELGHLLLHEGTGLHRDRALDGSARGSSSPQEREADIFAAMFLMPAKTVRKEFFDRFHTMSFVINDDTAFGLLGSGPVEIGQHRLSKRLADARHFHGVHFSSLADAFRVSVGAMAIRLQELQLLAS